MEPSREYKLDADGTRGFTINFAGYDTDEDRVDCYGNRSITKEEARILSRQIKESDGFDVDEIPKCFYLGIRRLSDVDLHYEMDDLRSYADVAIQDYNTKQNSNLEVLKVVKANVAVVSGFMFYITFEANDLSSGRSATFQAQVMIPATSDNPIVKLCRPKPSSSSSSSNP